MIAPSLVKRFAARAGAVVAAIVVATIFLGKFLWSLVESRFIVGECVLHHHKRTPCCSAEFFIAKSERAQFHVFK